MMPYEFEAINKNGFKEWIKKNIQPETFAVGLCAMVDSIESVTARVSTRGKWISVDEYGEHIYDKCSVCGNEWVCIEGTPKDNDMFYCPYCGAKMDLEDD